MLNTHDTLNAMGVSFMLRGLQVSIERFPIAGKFIIARGSKTEAVVVAVTLKQDGKLGRGECVPYNRYGETVEGVVAAIENLRVEIESGISKNELQNLMPAGAARNAVDCALWDLEAKLSGIPASVRACVQLRPVVTAYTISLGSPEQMAEATKKAADREILKIKLGGDGGDRERICAIREAAPKATLIGDANEGWTEKNLHSHLEACAKADFALIEQPLPANNDEILRSIDRIVPICADESVHGIENLDRLVGLYDFVNIKLDKTGGLTEALRLVEAARRRKFSIMIGCMVGTSLAMAPALLLAANAQFVDLDGPLLLARDRDLGLRYEGSVVYPPDHTFWG